MAKSNPVAWLSKAIAEATKAAKSTNYFTKGVLPNVDPGLEVDGLGPLKLPMLPATVTKLTALCQVAPYGKGTRTLVNKKVRNTFELDPAKFRLRDAWNAAIAAALPAIAQQLGLPGDPLEATLYKLLVYEKGGFFLPHRDSEKVDRMVASLIVALPNPFTGGRLVVSHGQESQYHDFDEAARQDSPSYAAFYADCEHEVQRVESGARLCLAYNLVLKKPAAVRTGKVAPKPSTAADQVAAAIEAWIEAQPGEPLVFALEHHYTQAGLSLDLLKGADRQLADLVVEAAEKAGCLAHLAQVERHLVEDAHDDGDDDYYYRSRRRPAKSEYLIGDVIEEELSGGEWASLDGAKLPWGTIPFMLEAVVSHLPIDDWKPTTEEYEGYTGNEGNTLERWYHRSALVLWRRDDHYEVLADAGAYFSVAAFGAMAAKLAKTPKKRLEAARADCLRFAQAIITRWPSRYGDNEAYATEVTAYYNVFPAKLLLLHDRALAATFLAALPSKDDATRIASFVVEACREFGWAAFAEGLTRLIETPPRHRHDVPRRDVEWLAALCGEPSDDPDKPTLANGWCARVVERYCEPRPPSGKYYGDHDSPRFTPHEASLELLLKALLATGRDADFARVTRFVRETPHEFRMARCLVPCVVSLVEWSRQRFGEIPASLADWRATLQAHLEDATAREPAPPADMAREANLACKCNFCGDLNAFLADPVEKQCRIPAAEAGRSHLIDEVRRHRSDVAHTLVRDGRPFSLVFTKTTASHARALKQYHDDGKLLETLRGAK